MYRNVTHICTGGHINDYRGRPTDTDGPKIGRNTGKITFTCLMSVKLGPGTAMAAIYNFANTQTGRTEKKLTH